MKIITAPHPTLRATAIAIDKIDKKTQKNIINLGKTLTNNNKPKGVGLAFPQVDKLLRAFVTYLPKNEGDKINLLNLYINPRIVKHSQKLSFGRDENNPTLEGCLSIPGIYGPVPRWEWVELEFDYYENPDLDRDSSSHLKSQKQRFEHYQARVIQHELDHLDGVLFTDYSLKYDLPIYKEKGEKLIEIDNLDFFHKI